MKVSPLQELLSHIGISFSDDNLLKKYSKEKPPLRLELFSADQMEQFAVQLSERHRIASATTPEQLLRRLADNEEVLVEVHTLLSRSLKAGRPIVPAGEWLLDNFYLIEEQILIGKKHLPKGYSEVLPKLANGPSKELPRVYDIAIEIISHSDGRVDLFSLNKFISAYQSKNKLNLGELWAIPIMLRLALIENLRRVAARIAIDRIYRNIAAYWADEMIDIAEKDQKNLILVIADMARSKPPLESSFVAELTRRLQGRGPALTLPLSWIEQRLAESGATTLEMVHTENQKQAADQVSISNSINSLRFLGTSDWRDFVEFHSVVESILRQDPTEVYPKMDFTTRDWYRHAIERISRRSKLTEEQIAETALTLARENHSSEEHDTKSDHIGYYLSGRGLSKLHKRAGTKFSIDEKLGNFVLRHPLLVYGTVLTIIVGILVIISMAKAWYADNSYPTLVTVAIIAAICASQLAVTLLNWIVTLFVKPGLLPRLNFSQGIPETSRTLVVIPTILFNREETEKLLESLEVRYLANIDEHLHFALLSDFPDAKTETMPEDGETLAIAKKGIEDLNRKYGHNTPEIFFLFHRPRKWNSHDKVWMGFERKRGKLGELNELLRGNTGDSFSVVMANQSVFHQIQYVITLDTDTQLPRDAARQMVAAMAHPMNKPHYNPKKRRVTEGYGILQPRVAVSLPGSGRSWYAKIHGNDPGIDPYTRAVSDVYQDLFGEGSFIGKGIYHIDTFEQALHGKFPNNHILSHDLLEGCYVRSGLITDVQLYEEYPSTYMSDVKRRHRWIRGDWQIADWALPWVPTANRKIRTNPLSALSRWKIFDNLRRSLVPPALIMILILSWTILHSALFWTLAVLAVIMLPSLINSAWNILNKPKEVLFWEHAKNSILAAGSSFLQNLLTLICLPYEALYSIDAIFRTNWRLLVSHQRLLEWNPSGNPKNENDGGTLPGMYFTMWSSGPLTALLLFFYLSVCAPIILIIAFPVLCLWLLSPAVVWWVSRPLKKELPKLADDQILFLRRMAARTWSFFETFVADEDNWLPPDNFQAHPEDKIAHRTSPTNIGFSILANLSAWDFGYITMADMLARTQKSLETMSRLERYRGHFFNWYDTQTLTTLPPRYISAVDSGNLAAQLLVMRQGILASMHEKIISNSVVDGFNDVWNILKDLMKNDKAVQEFHEELFDDEIKTFTTIEAGVNFIQRVRRAMEEFRSKFGNRLNEEGNYWLGTMESRIQSFENEIYFLAPWLRVEHISNEHQEIIAKIGIPTLEELRELETSVLTLLKKSPESDLSNLTEDHSGLFNCIVEASRRAEDRLAMIERLLVQLEDFADMEFDFLYDKSQHLLAIGYNVDDHRRDNSFYDLLASEARMGVFVAISQGKLPQESWFSLGRQLTNTGISPVLLSWSGSMFEYLMPLLLMPTYDDTLLDESNKSMVAAQIEYGKERNVPWGISESGYNMVDAAMNYQYKAFGVPGLGFKRGLGEDLVVAPYASVLALMVNPEASLRNLKELATDGYSGRYGFYEAIDFTAARMPRGQNYVTIRSFMAHHQGMSLLAIDYLLHDKPMQKRFIAEPRFQASLLLLHERIPQTRVFYTHSPEADNIQVSTGETEMRIIQTPHTISPQVQLLSNGRYHVMVSNSGGGYSRWKNLAVTRWREDGTSDDWGTFCYIHDLDNSVFWSSGYHPARTRAKQYEVVFSQGRAEFRRRDNDIETHTEIVVSPEDDIEMRRVHIHNRSRRTRTLEITSYAEVVLNSPIADALHPAFNNLFVQTEINTQRHSILCTRRPRSSNEQMPWMFHLMKVRGVDAEEVSYETDRSKFIGRCNTLERPDAMRKPGKLSDSQGSVLDPVVAIRYRITLQPEESAMVDLVFGMGDTREICDVMVEKYQDQRLADRAAELAWTHSQVVLRQINASEMDARLYSSLAGSVIYANPVFRADPNIITQNRRGQSGLWSYSISGDLPIVLLQIENASNINLVKQLVHAHAYWRLKGLTVDLVIWNEDHGGYRQALQNQILGLIAAAIGAEVSDKPGGIFVRSGDQISPEDRILFQTVARIIISDSMGTLEEQLNRRPRLRVSIPNLSPVANYQSLPEHNLPSYDLLFSNSLGGFSKDGREYIITIPKEKRTPAPWSNVIANKRFGTVITESGQAYTWMENAHELRLSPWDNDPVRDSAGEQYYLRDEDTGHFWSLTRLPHPGQSPYMTHHGFGYSVFLHEEAQISSEMRVYVDTNAPVKFIVIKLKNRANRTRRLSATGCIEWVLGDLRPKSVMHIVTEIDTAGAAILARNHYNTEWGNRVAFFDVDESTKTITCDRTEFLGRNGNFFNPDALFRTKLSGKSGAAMDPCGAIQIQFDLEPGDEREIIFRLGAASDLNEATNLIAQYKGRNAAHVALKNVLDFWTNILGSIVVNSPDLSFDLLANGWLKYQTITSRIFARSGFYQSGGAFGFRDQLQDVIALITSLPEMAKDQILLAASRQFREGDVQHWWHPPIGRGVRTRCSDDMLWLPFVTARYVLATGDQKILDEQIGFLEGRLLNVGEESYYDLPARSDEKASLYEHCLRAIRYAAKYGANGLPLMGSGDWNDGMDKVGLEGKGESVWLGFFLYLVLVQFKKLAVLKKDMATEEFCTKQANELNSHIESNAWDGEWFRRAYFDDGTPLGSTTNDECKIDSIAQSWSVLSGAVDKNRSAMAMESAYKFLVKKNSRIIQLFDPPFNKSKLDPGYIKGYVPGVRENGGQYTHAAVWMIMAFAYQGKMEIVWELFNLINPINHSNDAASMEKYKVEPYVIAADVYGGEQHTGRGGWTWYTGSAGWLYQLITEYILGLKREGTCLRFEPCIPANWKSLKMQYKYGNTTYKVNLSRAEQPLPVPKIKLDGVEQNGHGISLSDDQIDHVVDLSY